MNLKPVAKGGVAGIAAIRGGGQVICRPPLTRFDSLDAVSCPNCKDPWETVIQPDLAKARETADFMKWLDGRHDAVLTCGRCGKTFGMMKRDGGYVVAEAVS